MTSASRISVKPCSIESDSMGDGPSKLRVVSFNVRNGLADDGPNRWERRQEQVKTMLQDLDPDIVALQEPFVFQMDAIAAALPGHRRLGVGREDGDEEGEICGLFIREPKLRVVDWGTFWFSDTTDVPGATGWGNTLPRCCTWAEIRLDSGSLFAYNLHLDHESQTSRQKSVELLNGRLQRPCIVLGDFNATPESQEVQAVTLADAFRASSDFGQGTYHGFTGHPLEGPIDHIFIDPTLRVASAWLDRRHEGGRFPSDHFALVADILLPQPPFTIET